MKINEKIQLAGLSYTEYKKKISSYLENTEAQSLDETERERFGFTRLNQQRIHRVEKTYQPSEAVITLMQKITKPQTWMILTAIWCGDSAANVPVLAKIAALNPFVNVLFVERDENLAVMDQYLTNGVRSIPKLVVFNEEGEELFIWGSRPAAAQALVLAQKGLGVPMSEWEEKLHLWYAKDRGKNLENEICEALEGQFTSSRL